MSRLIFPGSQKPVVAASVAKATDRPAVAIAHPAQLVAALMQHGAERRIDFRHKEGVVLILATCGPLVIPLEFDVATAKQVHEVLGKSIEGASPKPPEPEPVALTEDGCAPTGDAPQLHYKFDGNEEVFRLHWPPRENDVLPFVPADAIADSPTDEPPGDAV